ncbi:MAG: PQQ-binding-like beta-propeller repeat protein, partial [Myxococcota bacterium]
MRAAAYSGAVLWAVPLGVVAMRTRVLTLLSLAVMPLLTACEEPVVKVFEYVASAPVYSTPALAGDLIIFGSENGDESAISKKGEFTWKYTTRREVVSAIKVAEGMVFFGSTNNTFYALDLAGREVWKYTTLGRLKGDPLVLKDKVIFGSYDKHVYAVGTTTGQRIWTYPAEAAPSAA